jgi:hypothetical protein
MYTHDGQQLCWKGKPSQRPRGPDARLLSETYATDGKSLFWAHRVRKLPPGQKFDFSRLRLRARTENPVNPSEAVLDDGNGVWHIAGVTDNSVSPLEGATFEAVRWFEDPRFYVHLHQYDDQHVWFRGLRLEGLEARKASLLSNLIATDEDRVWFCGKRQSDLTRADITFICERGWHDLIRTDAALLALDKRDGSLHVLANAAPPPPASAVTSDALNAIAHDLFGVFDLHEPLLTNTDDIDWAAVTARPRIPLAVSFDGARLVVGADGIAPVICAPDEWYRALCTIWLHRRALPGALRTYSNVGTMLPNGHDFRETLIQRNRDVYLAFCGATFTQGAEVSARMLLHAYLQTRWFRQASPFDDRDCLLAQLPRRLFDDCTYAKRAHGFSSTTNLAAARHVVISGLLEDPDPRVRLEMLGLIHATVLATNKFALFVKDVLPALLAREQQEPLGCVIEHIDAALQAFIIRGLVDAETSHVRTAHLVEPIVRRQIAHGVDVALNHGRLIEVLIHQDREDEAKIALEAFKAEFGQNFRLPGVYVHRPLHQTVDEAVEGMRERAAALSG